MDKRPPGRPPKPEHEKRTEYIRIRLTSEERQLIDTVAHELQISKTKTVLKGVQLLAKKTK